MKKFIQKFGFEKWDTQVIYKAKSKEEKLKEAYLCLEESKKRGELVTLDDFKYIKSDALFFKEDGRGFTQNEQQKQSFYQNQQETQQIKDMSFDLMVRHQVFKILKYQGSFCSLIKTRYIISEESKDQFFFQASQKVPVYFTYYSCGPIQKQLMDKYLENPFNSVMFVTYGNSLEDNKQTLVRDNPSQLQRQIQLETVYSKFAYPVPNLLCLGDQASCKSKLLNDFFGVHFEVIQKSAIGLFHDSVDAVFHSQECPTGFNIFDFQGVSNDDVILIQTLLTQMPRSCLLLQVNSIDYCDRVLAHLSANLRKAITPRILVLIKANRTKQKVAIEKKITESLFPGIDAKTQIQIFDLNTGGVRDNSPAYQSKCRDTYVQLQDQFCNNDLTKELFVQQVTELSQKLVLNDEHEKNDQNLIYEQIYGTYWLLEDCLSRVCKDQTEFQVMKKPTEFREAHFKVKKFLYNCYKDGAILMREDVFPFYIRDLKMSQIRKKLSKSQNNNLSKSSIQELQSQLEELQLTMPKQNELFQMYLDYFTQDKQDIVTDLLQLVEAFYMPRVKVERQLLAELKKKYEQNQDKLKSHEMEDGKLWSDTTEEQKAEYEQIGAEIDQTQKEIQKVLVSVEKLVLDSELFTREAKQLMLQSDTISVDRIKRSKFNTVMAKQFENGHAMEIIDGDTDKVQAESLQAVTQWVSNLKKNNSKLLIVTIIGPQSSGKSTLMNLLFGSKFKVSAGRCTKGLNAMLLRIDEIEGQNMKEILILDSEGLFSIERNDAKFDRSLAVFCITVSNLLLINVKGELSSEIEKVMEVAIFALNKIVQSFSLLKKPRVHFILRDQVEQNTALMQKSYSMLKSSLQRAARSSGGADLQDLIELPEDSDNVITLLTNALEHKKVNDSARLVQIVSSEVFRQSCCALRLKIVQIWSELSNDVKTVNLEKWGKDVPNLWKAVQKHDDLLSIKDLEHINDHRVTVETMTEFYSLMRRTQQCVRQRIELDLETQYIENPLLKWSTNDKFASDRYMAAENTICSQIDQILSDQINHLTQSIKKGKTAELIIEDQTMAHKGVKEEIHHKYLEQVLELTRDKGPDVQQLASRSLSNIVQTIFDESLITWEDSQSQALVEDCLTRVKWLISEKEFEKKKSQDSETSLQEYEDVINGIVEKTHLFIKNQFVRDPDGLREIALREYLQVCHIDNKAFDLTISDSKTGNINHKRTFKILQTTAKCLEQTDAQMGVFEVNSEVQDSEVYLFAMPDETWISALSEVVIDSIDYTDALSEIMLLESDLKLAPTDDLKLRLIKAFEKRDQALSQATTSLLEEFTPKIKDKIGKRFTSLRESIQACICKIQAFNDSKPDVQQNIPDKLISDLLEVFNHELIQQGLDMKIKPVKSKDDLIDLVYYDQERYIDSFNQIIFNQLLSQTHRNQAIKTKKINDKLNELKTQALQYPEKVKIEIDQDLEAARDYINLVVNLTIVKVLFESLLIQNKEEISDALQNPDSPSTQEALLRWLQNSNDSDLQQLKKTDTLSLDDSFSNMRVKFNNDKSQALTHAREFFEQVASELANCGRQIVIDNLEIKQDFLRYFYITLCKDMLQASCDSKCDTSVQGIDSLRQKVETHQMYSDDYSLPSIAPKLITSNSPKIKSDELITLLVQLAAQINSIDRFVKLAVLEIAK